MEKGRTFFGFFFVVVVVFFVVCVGGVGGGGVIFLFFAIFSKGEIKFDLRERRALRGCSSGGGRQFNKKIVIISFFLRTTPFFSLSPKSLSVLTLFLEKLQPSLKRGLVSLTLQEKYFELFSFFSSNTWSSTEGEEK